MTFDMNLFIYLCYNIARVYLICSYADLFLKDKELDVKYRYIMLFSYLTLNTILYLIDDRYINMLSNIILFFIFTYLYKSNFIMRVFCTIMVYIINMVYEGFAYLLISKVHKDIYSDLFAYIFICICLYVTERVLNLIFHKNRFYKIRLKYILITFMIPVGSIFVCAKILQSNNISLSNVFCIFIMFLINISVFYIFNEIIKTYDEIHKNSVAELEKECYKNQLELISESDNRISKIRHDFKNHMIVTKSYIYENKNDLAINYINTVINNMYSPKRIVNSGNMVIDSIINYKLKEELNIDYQIKAKVPEKLFISDYHISIILGNLIDNALNALSKLEDRKLNIVIEYNRGLIYIMCENTFVGLIERDGERILSTNRDKDNHGFGISNIREVVNLYNGDLNIETHNNIFRVDIILYQTDK